MLNRPLSSSFSKGLYQRHPAVVPLSLLIAGLVLAPSGHSHLDSRADRIELGLEPGAIPVTLNEPVFVTLWIRNGNSASSTVDLGGNCREGLEVTVTFPDGGRRLLDLPRVPGGGISADCRISLQPGEIYSRKLLLNNWLGSWPVGTYYVETSLADGMKTSTNIEIAARDPSRLREVCKSLASTALSFNAADALQADEALGFVADEACLPMLARVLREGTRGNPGAIKALVRLGTVESFATLAGVWGRLDDYERSLTIVEATTLGRLEALDAALAEAGRQ